MPEQVFQQPGQPVRIGEWAAHEDFEVFPVGSKPKRLLICPELVPERFLIPRHSYLFKTAPSWRAQQVWSEIFAYRVGALVGLPVPPCFAAVDERTGETGVLVEFFYGYPEEDKTPRLVHASDLMTRLLTDRRRGRPHFMRVNYRLTRRLIGDDEATSWWAKTLAFDALIGNTDRHPTNWGFLVHQNEGNPLDWAMSPIFDNGTSLGYEVRNDNLTRMRELNELKQYVMRGRHHCGWEPPHDGPMPHFHLCKHFVDAYESAGLHMRDVIRFDMDQITAIADELVQFALDIPFTQERARFVTALIGARKAELEALIAD